MVFKEISMRNYDKEGTVTSNITEPHFLDTNTLLKILNKQILLNKEVNQVTLLP